MIGLLDRAGSAYGYGYDGAGRLRAVGRTKAKGNGMDAAVTSFGWYAYAYDEPDPIELWEGQPGLGTLAATWSYDALGRTKRAAMTPWRKLFVPLHTRCCIASNGCVVTT